MNSSHIRVLAWPYKLVRNTYFQHLNEGLEAKGFGIDDFNYRRALRGRYDILHIHYPTFPFRNPSMPIALARLGIVVALLTLAKLRGQKIVWTVHNLANHERFHPWLEAAFMGWFTQRVDLSIHLSKSGRRAALERFPALGKHASAVIPHPHYGVPATAVPRFIALAKLGLPFDAVVLLALGEIRSYKNIPVLIDAFRNCAGDKLRLVIAGAIQDPAIESEIRSRASDPRIVLAFGSVPDEWVPVYMSAATIFVAAFRDILNSGSALLSLSHACPVLVPDLGAMGELQSLIGDDWVRLYMPPLTTDTLTDAVKWAQHPRNAVPDLTSFAPEVIVAAHRREFLNLLGRTEPQTHGRAA